MKDMQSLLDQGAEWVPLIVEGVTSLALGLVVFFVGKFIASKVAKWCESRLLKSSVDKAVASFTSNVLYALMFAAVVLMALGQVGVVVSTPTCPKAIKTTAANINA